MRNAVLVVVLAVAVILQLSFLPALRPFGVVPNILLPIIVCIGLYGRASTAVLAAVLCGLCMDMASGTDFGVWTGTFVLAALACGFVHRAGVELVSAVSLVIVALGIVVANGVILTSVFGAAGPWSSVISSLLIQLVIDLIITAAIGPAVRAIVGQGNPEILIG